MVDVLGSRELAGVAVLGDLAGHGVIGVQRAVLGERPGARRGGVRRQRRRTARRRPRPARRGGRRGSSAARARRWMPGAGLERPRRAGSCARSRARARAGRAGCPGLPVRSWVRHGSFGSPMDEGWGAERGPLRPGPCAPDTRPCSSRGGARAGIGAGGGVSEAIPAGVIGGVWGTGVPAAGGREAPGPNVTSRERTQAGCRQGAGTGSPDASRAFVPRGRAVPSLVAYSTLSCQEKVTRTVLE